MILKLMCIWLLSCTASTETPEDAVGFPSVERLEITTNIKTRFAVTEMRASVYNFEDTSVEAKNTFFLPLTSFISNFTALVGETLFVGEVETRDEAQERYEDATRDDKSAGIIHQSMESAPDGFAPFSITLNVGPRERIVFILEYQEVLMRYMSRYEILIPTISTEMIHHFSVRAIIEDDNEITRFDFSESPIERIRQDTNNQEFLYSATEPNSMKASIEFDVLNADDSGILYVDPDMQYFVHFFSPPGLQVLSKQIVFVIDCSGSMEGDKISQAKDAMRKVLDILLPEDRFDVLCFDSTIVRWGSGLNEASEENRRIAKNWINENVRPKDMTNIEEGLISAISVLKSGGALSMPTVVFLTDGRPTTGETDSVKIRQRVKAENSQGMCIHSLGFGEGADMMFLNALSLENCGIAWKVFANVDAGIDIENFFDTASQPLVRNVGVQYKVESTPIESDLYGTNYEHYFAGMEVITAGRFPDGFDSDVEIDVEGISALGDYTQSKLIPRASINEKPYIPRMWAHLWIQHLSRQIAVADLDPSLDKSALEAEATAIALEYQLVTPFTSFVIVVDDQNDEDSKNTKSPTMQTGISMTNEEYMYASQSSRNDVAQLGLVYALFMIFLRL